MLPTDIGTLNHYYHHEITILYIFLELITCGFSNCCEFKMLVNFVSCTILVVFSLALVPSQVYTQKRWVNLCCLYTILLLRVKHTVVWVWKLNFYTEEHIGEHFLKLLTNLTDKYNGHVLLFSEMFINSLMTNIVNWTKQRQPLLCHILWTVQVLVMKILIN